MIVVDSLSMRDPLGAAELLQRDVFELDAELFGDELAGGQNCDVFEHRLAAVAEARRLHRRDFQAAAQLVDDEGGERLAFDVLGDDDERLAGLHHGFENGQQRLQRRELLFVDENVGIFEFGDHLLGVGDEIGREIAAVELHALDDLRLGDEVLGFLDGDDAFIADLLHRLGDLVADEAVAIGRDAADLGDLLIGGDLLRVLFQIGDDGLDREIDAALQIHRIEAGRHRLRAFAGDRGGEHGRGGGAVARIVMLFRGDLAHQLGAEIFELVGKLDLLGDGDAVLGDARRPEGFFDDDVAALWPKRDLHRIVENFDAGEDAVPRIRREADVFGSHGLHLLQREKGARLSRRRPGCRFPS